MIIFFAAADDLICAKLLARIAKDAGRDFATLGSAAGIERGRDLDRLADILDQSGRSWRLMLDSGAFTFHRRFWKGENIRESEILKFRDKYVEAILQACRKPTYAVELDVQHELGSEWVARQREEVWLPLAKETGIEIVYVWQHEDGPAGFKSLVENPRVSYIAFGTVNRLIRAGYGPMLIKMVRQAYLARKRVHGFAVTNPTLLMIYPFFSSDSISWLTFKMWQEGTVYVGEKRYSVPVGEVIRKKMRLPTNRQGRAGWNVLAKMGAMPNNEYALIRAAFNSYWEMAHKITRLWQSRGIDWSWAE